MNATETIVSAHPYLNSFVVESPDGKFVTAQTTAEVAAIIARHGSYICDETVSPRAEALIARKVAEAEAAPAAPVAEAVAEAVPVAPVACPARYSVAELLDDLCDAVTLVAPICVNAHTPAPATQALTPAELAEARALRDELMAQRDAASSPMGEGCGAEALASVRGLLAYAAAWDAQAEVIAAQARHEILTAIEDAAHRDAMILVLASLGGETGEGRYARALADVEAGATVTAHADGTATVTTPRGSHKVDALGRCDCPATVRCRHEALLEAWAKAHSREID